jgi:hypothetical protein
MKLASLKEGQFVETGGYYTKGDAGQAKYLIVAAQAADGYGDHVLANGTVAVLQLTNNVTNARQVGCTGDGSTNDTVALQTAAANPLCRNLYLPEGVYKVTDTILFNYPVSFYGDGVKSQLAPDATMGATTDVLKIVPTGSGVKRGYKFSRFSIVPSSVRPARYGLEIDLTDPTSIMANFLLEDILTEELGSYALHLTNPTNVDGFFTSSIQRNKLKGGMRFERIGDSINISENTLSGRNEGVRLSGIVGASQVIIEKNNITASGGAIVVDTYIEQLKIRDNQLEQSQVYDGDAGVNLGACIRLIGSAAYDNDLTEITGNNINNFGLASYCITTDYTTNLKISGNVMAARTAAGFGTNHMLISANSKGLRLYADNTFLSSDTMLETEQKITNLGEGTAGIEVPITDFLNGWTEADSVNYPTYVYKCPASDLISMAGAVNGGTVTSGTAMFNLPAGFGPKANTMYPVVNQTAALGFGNPSGIVNVLEALSVTVRKVATSSTTTLYLDSINYLNRQVTL